MTTNVDIVNRALQGFGSRTTVASLTEASNEATQANISIFTTRDEVLRMAPWNSATIFDNLTYMTSLPGTPENSSPSTATWQRGQPAPPWLYEYQYPADCARPLWLIPNLSNAFNGVPIYPAGVATGFSGLAPLFSRAVPFQVATDFVYSISAATPVAGGSGYAVGDFITLGIGAGGGAVATPGDLPVGAPANLQVTAVTGIGAVQSAQVISQVNNAPTPVGGSYFYKQTQPVLGYRQGTSPFSADVSFNLTYNAQGFQRVILTNIPNPTCALIAFLNDPSVMDPMLQQAWVSVLSARLCVALNGNTAKANDKLKEANVTIEAARTADGNEGLTVNDVTPDWLRARGIQYIDQSGVGFDWGPLFPMY